MSCERPRPRPKPLVHCPTRRTLDLDRARLLVRAGASLVYEGNRCAGCPVVQALQAQRAEVDDLEASWPGALSRGPGWVGPGDINAGDMGRWSPGQRGWDERREDFPEWAWGGRPLVRPPAGDAYEILKLLHTLKLQTSHLETSHFETSNFETSNFTP